MGFLYLFVELLVVNGYCGEGNYFLQVVYVFSKLLFNNDYGNNFI